MSDRIEEMVLALAESHAHLKKQFAARHYFGEFAALNFPGPSERSAHPGIGRSS